MKHFPTKLIVLSILLITLLYCCTGDNTEKSDAKPNILVLMMDDFGYNDLGINNENTETPTERMNQFAADSMRFSQFYTESTCAPSRAAFMTGRYPARFGFRPVSRGIPSEVITLPEALKTLGYNTHFTGKWHLGFSVEEAMPAQQGFNTSFGFLNQWLLRAPKADGTLNFPTYKNPLLQDNSGIRKQYQGHLSDILTDHTVKLINNNHHNNNSQKEPWFIYHAFFAPHTPIQPAKRYAKQYPKTPAGQYHALIKQLDDNIGKILKALEDSGQADNTIVVLASDNGGTNKQINNNHPYSGKKNTYLEGGVRTPMIIHWPEKFPSGETFELPVTIFDLYPTLVKLAGGNPTNTLDGIDLAEALDNHQLLDRTLFWEGFGASVSTYSVFSEQRWRFYRHILGEEFLFDFHDDPTGHDNIIDDNQPIMKALQKKYVTWRNHVRKIKTTFTTHDEDGKGILTGNDFQRSPGLSGFSFAIGVTPEACNDAEEHSSKVQNNESTKEIYRTIADQRDLFYIGHSSTEGVKVEIDGQVLYGPVLSKNSCHSIIISSFFNRNISPISSQAPTSPIALYIDGQLVDQTVSAEIAPPMTGLSNATYIGFSPDKEVEFHGQLSQPIILNQQLFLEEKIHQPGITPIANQVCSEEH